MVPLAMTIVGSKSTCMAGGASSAHNSTKNKRLSRPRSEGSEDQGDNRDQKHSIQRVIPSMSARRIQGEKQIKCFFFSFLSSYEREEKNSLSDFSSSPSVPPSSPVFPFELF